MCFSKCLVELRICYQLWELHFCINTLWMVEIYRLLLLYDVLLTRFGVFEDLPALSNDRLRLVVHNNTYAKKGHH